MNPVLLALAMSLSTPAPAVLPPPAGLLPSLVPAARQAASESALIAEDRRAALAALARDIRAASAPGQSWSFVFICTHNSRRSHLAQVWAQTAALWYGVPGVSTFSGGTEVTACNPRTVAALRRQGFPVEATSPEPNPRYRLQYADAVPPLTLFSKRFSDPANPSAAFIAIMTCSEADEACPYVPGARIRCALPYVDPKVADGTPEESSTYDARARQIAREMFFLFSLLASAPAA